MKVKINNLELSSTIFLLIFSCTLGIAPFISLRIASIDSYISAVIGAILGIIPLLIYLYIFNYQIDKPLNEKTKLIFGKTLGTIINYLTIPFFLILGITSLFNISNFVISQYLTDTPLLLISTILGVTSLYIARRGIKTLTKTSQIYMVIIIVIVLTAVFGLLKEMKLDNLKPILEYGLKKPFIAGLFNSINFTIPMFTTLLIPKKEIENNNKTTKYIVITYLISAIIIFLVSLIPSTVLGKYLVNIYQYPVYITLKKISFFNFIDRIENFLSIQWILSGIITISMTIYAISKNITTKSNSGIIDYIITIIIVISPRILFKNNTTFNNYLYKIYPYLLIPLLVIYIIIVMGIVIKKRKKR